MTPVPPGSDAVLLHARHALLAGSVTVRRRYLEEELLPQALRIDLEQSQVQDLVRLLMLTVPRYLDAPSRAAVLPVLAALLRPVPSSEDSSVTPHRSITPGMIKWLDGEVDRSSKSGTVAAGSKFVLLSWGLTILDSTTPGMDAAQLDSLLGSIAVLVDALLDPESNPRGPVRKSVQVMTRRSVRTNYTMIPSLLAALTSGKAEPVYRNACLLGIVIDVSLRLKLTRAAVGRSYLADAKASIDSFYLSNVVSAKTAPLQRVLDAFVDYSSAYVMLETVESIYLPTMERMLIRSPEVSLAVIAAFVTAVPSITSAVQSKLLPAILVSSKSTSAATRGSSLRLFDVLFTQAAAASLDLDAVAEQVYAPLKAGKTSSPDHRTTLFTMLGSLAPTAKLSTDLVHLTLSLLPKESNDVAVAAMMRVVAVHLPTSLVSGATLEAAQVTALIKGMQEPKPTIRRSVCSTVGAVLWSLDGESDTITDAVKSFGESVLPGLESGLKTVTTNPLNAPAGPLEGLIAVAVLKGRLGRWGVKKINDFIASNPTMQTIHATGAKPSFLLWDKVWRKLSSTEDEAWLTYALESVVTVDEDRFAKDVNLRSAFAHALIHLGSESSHHSTRLNVAKLVTRVTARSPKVMHSIMRDGLRSWLLAGEKLRSTAKITILEDGEPVDKAPRLRPLLFALATFSDSTTQELREELLTDLLVIAHHPRLGLASWVDLLQRIDISPEVMVTARLDALLARIFADASTNPSSQQFAQAAYSAATTLAFVAPKAAVPRLFAQLEDDLSLHHLAFIGPTEYGIWATPEGVAFVDVLTAAKPKVAISHKNSKEREIEIWEEELREALARKKPAAASLTKPERILLERQISKEALIRKDVAEALGRLRRGFALLLAMVSSKAELVREYLATMVNDVLAVIVTRPATLVAPDAFATYQTLGSICSDRLGASKVALGAAVLRGVEAQIVPAELSAEPLAALVTRVLYRMRYLAEQLPFDAGTFAYAAPLISRIVRSGGIGLEKGDTEAILEQLALAVDLIAFHARSCSETAFPRLSMIGDLIATLAVYPTLSRTATGALTDMCEAMRATATRPEIDALLAGALTEEVYVRFACLQALQPLDLTDLTFPVSLWIACHDLDDRNRQLAVAAWEENGLDVPESFLPELIPCLAHSSNAVREATAHAIAEGIKLHPLQVSQAIRDLVVEYREKAKELMPMYDQYGMIVEDSLTVEDPWRTRVAQATTFKFISTYFQADDVESFFSLLIQGEALGDRNQAVRSEMLDAAMVVIDLHGKENLQALIATFEEYLGRPSTGDEVQDHITEALVILFGRLARHLDPSDPRIAGVIGRLVDALRTPSEVVQAAVCDCLPPLIKVIKDQVPALVDQLLTDLFTAPKYAERRGAAYGLAGVVRGRGMSTLKEFGILGRLRDNAEDKKSLQARQGAVFGYEVLSTVLGRLFEPYIMDILPLLLTSFGDTSPDVRDATQDAAKAIMTKLSGHAVKLILPTLLTGLDDKQWRAKKGAIELMGAMAFLAPKQLSLSLPTIIPRLADVLTDTHKQVRESANTSLKRFGEVVTNPEIQSMQAVLLEALVDPSRKTPKALDALLATTFAHFIDSSSLALVIPILDRGLRERSADVKRKASAIVGNMATLTDAKDLVPYLSQLVPLLRGVLVDPVPEARSTAAKSLGGLVERLGENNFPTLIETLLAVLKSPSSGVDQQGAAQGLSEVLAGLGTDRLESLLPTILANTSSPRAYVREGHISLLIFLPATFGDRFSPYLGKIIQPVLSGLADDSDYVREASMKAGRMIVAQHSTKAIDLLLPELERGLFDESWRIRQSSVQLVGDLLFRISGVTGKPDEDETGEDDDNDNGPANDNTKKALVDTLGKERRDRVFAALYIVRQDSTGVVRQAAIHVWKALVQNTPRTVREILPLLMQIIVRTLASPGYEQRETAARCLAETCRKLGEAVLGEVISILQKAMASPDRRQREGVCLALTEIMANTSKSHLESHEGAVIEIVRGALVDSDPVVRTAAAQAFDAAQQSIGPRSIDETIPTLLDALQQPGETSEAALAALKEVMQVRAEKIFPVLIPRLIAAPITAFNARALASLVQVAGAALGKRITNIVDALQKAQAIEQDEDTLAQLGETLSAVLGSVEDHESGLGTLQMHMLGLSKSDSPAKRVAGCGLFARFCQATEADFSDYTVDWIRQLISLFDDRAPEVVGAAWTALDALVKTIDKEDLEPLVVPLRRTIENTGTPGQAVDGFSRPNGLKPILPILLQGLLAGTGEQREQAAYALGDLVERTSPEAFKAYCIQTVGPLIRVIGDRFPAPVKSAILSTLTILLTRVPQFVKPFFPQLQRTFVKSLSDASSSVRSRGSAALGVLMLHQPRVDPLITELTNLAATETAEVRDAVVGGLANVVASGGANLSEGSKSAILDIVSEAFVETNKETYNSAIARLVGAFAIHDPPALETLITSHLIGDIPSTQLSSMAIREIVDQAPKALYDLDLASRIVARVVANVASTQPPAISRPGREVKELFKEREPWASDASILSQL